MNYSNLILFTIVCWGCCVSSIQTIPPWPRPFQSFSGDTYGNTIFPLKTSLWAAQDTNITGFELKFRGNGTFQISATPIFHPGQPFTYAASYYDPLTKDYVAVLNVPTCIYGNRTNENGVTDPNITFYIQGTDCSKSGICKPASFFQDSIQYEGTITEYGTYIGSIYNKNHTIWNGTIVGPSKMVWNATMPNKDTMQSLYHPYAQILIRIYNTSYVQNQTGMSIALGVDYFSLTKNITGDKCSRQFNTSQVSTFTFPLNETMYPIQTAKDGEMYFELPGQIINGVDDNATQTIAIFMTTTFNNTKSMDFVPIWFEVDAQLVRRKIGFTKETWGFIIADVLMVLVFVGIIYKIRAQQKEQSGYAQLEQ